jgi:hypothetical protein
MTPSGVHPQLMMATDRNVFEGRNKYGVEELALSLPRDATIISFTSMIRRNGAPLLALTLALSSTSVHVSTPGSGTHASNVTSSGGSGTGGIGSPSSHAISGSSGLTNSGLSSASSVVPTRYMLHIYGARSTAAASLHDVSHDCQVIELAYTPFLLTHTRYITTPLHCMRHVPSRDHIDICHDDYDDVFA